MGNGTERQAPFAPVPNGTVTIAAVTSGPTAASATLTPPSAPFQLIDNYMQVELVTGANPCYFGWGTSSGAAAAQATVANGYPVPANTRRVISIPANAINIAAISVTGASSCTATSGVGV